MHALMRLFEELTARVRSSRPVQGSGPLAGRPMTGFFAGLTPEQRRKALAYRGPENHGSDEFHKV